MVRPLRNSRKVMRHAELTRLRRAVALLYDARRGVASLSGPYLHFTAYW
jgi:ribosomal protein L15E